MLFLEMDDTGLQNSCRFGVSRVNQVKKEEILVRVLKNLFYKESCRNVRRTN